MAHVGRPALKDQPYLHIRTPLDIRATIEDIAEEETRTLAQMSLVLLKEAIRERQRRAALAAQAQSVQAS